ncbi:MAG: peptidoglycan DD-metalloendopeptidase family protein, partial [Flavobacteriales bacterium]|nr:peptidoglycan DD-metalloendopeptidase family protein [Flavobacteriales bacterium]
TVSAYYDEKGESLKKAFLKAPVKYSRISSRFTGKRFHPVLKRYKSHLGTDYAAPHGTPIFAVGDGTVSKSGYTKGNGNYVKIRHNSTYETQYLHMSKRAAKVGDHVQQGDVIGYVGSTGLATGPHVCFRFWKNGKQVDHLREDFPPSEPISEAEMDTYLKAISTLDSLFITTPPTDYATDSSPAL